MTDTEVGGLSLRTIAGVFGVSSVSGVSHQINALRREIEAESATREDVKLHGGQSHNLHEPLH